MSQQTYLIGLSEKERRQFLENGAASIEEGKYMKPLYDEELAEAKNQLSENCIKLSDFNEELALVKKEFKDKMEPYAVGNKILLTEIRSKQRIVMGSLYHLPNYDDGFMESYNASGELISTRRLLPTEKQGNVFNIGNAASK